MNLYNLSNKDIGIYGEGLAVEFLIKNGYTILERNYRYKRYEIDIICSKSKLLIFVEVKLRTSIEYGYPEEFVKNNKIKSVKIAAMSYISKVDWQRDVRYDIIAVEVIKNEIKISHFEDAFY
jgi:putative endonuclease